MVDEGGGASLDGERRMDIIYEEEEDRRQTQWKFRAVASLGYLSFYTIII